MAQNTDFFEVKIPFDSDNPLNLKDLQGYFLRLEEFFASNGIEVEVYEARVGSFIPKFRQVMAKGANALLTLTTVLSNVQTILNKVENSQPLSHVEQKTIQPFVAINSKVTIQNININGKTYDTSAMDPGVIFQENDVEKSEKMERQDAKMYESQELLFTKIDTNKNNNCAGMIKSIDEDAIKKVAFASQEIKDMFEFSEVADPFKHVFIVDVKVHYNENGTVAKYEIINLIDSKDANYANE